MTECIALIRGINVGRANRVSMSDLRDLFAAQGFTHVRTLLNSGNVLFQSSSRNAAKLASVIEKAIADQCGFCAAVAVVSAQELTDIIEENSLLHVAKDPARHLVAFVAHPKLLTPLRPMLKGSWTPDALAIGDRAAYLWCSTGILDSKMLRAFVRQAGASVTTRNWATVLKLQAAAGASE